MKFLILVSLLTCSSFAQSNNTPDSGDLGDIINEIALKELSFVSNIETSYDSKKVSLEEAKEIVKERLVKINDANSDEMANCQFQFKDVLSRLSQYDQTLKYNLQYKFSGKMPKKVLFFNTRLSEKYNCELRVHSLDSNLIIVEQITKQFRQGYEYRDTFPCSDYNDDIFAKDEDAFLAYSVQDGTAFYDGVKIITSTGTYSRVSRNCETKKYKIQNQ